MSSKAHKDDLEPNRAWGVCIAHRLFKGLVELFLHSDGGMHQAPMLQSIGGKGFDNAARFTLWRTVRPEEGVGFFFFFSFRCSDAATLAMHSAPLVQSVKGEKVR